MRYRIILILFALLISSCSSITEVQQFDQYQSIRLQKTQFMPTLDDLSEASYDIAVAVDNGKIKMAEQTNLAIVLSNALENLIEQTGNVNIVSREKSGKLLHEVLIAEDRQINGWQGELFARYFLFGKITHASFNRKFQAGFYSKRSGFDVSQHYYSPRCMMTAFVSGALKIYQMPSMKVLKTIHFEDNQQAGEDVKNKEDCDKLSNKNHLLVNATLDGIWAIRSKLFNYFAIKGYVMSAKQKNGSIIVETTLKQNRVNAGDKVLIYHIKKVNNPLTQMDEQIEEKVAEGIVTDLSNSKRTWIRMGHSEDDIMIGDIVKPFYQPNNMDFFKKMGKQINRLNTQ
jgi:hypothetical protein